MISDEAEENGITFRYLREGANHTIFLLGKGKIKIGRHSTLKPGDVRATLQETEKELGAKWWQ